MLSLVPWGTNGVSLDLMRRSPQSPNGTNELMVSELCLQGEDIGVTRISLNFAMLNGILICASSPVIDGNGSGRTIVLQTASMHTAPRAWNGS